MAITVQFGKLADSVGINDVYSALKLILNVLTRPMWVESSTSRLKTTVEAITTVATLTTLNQIAGFDAKTGLTNALERINWNTGVRRCIT